MKLFALLLSILLFSSTLNAQSVVDQLGVGSGASSVVLPDMATETINRISASRKIFIISNNAGTFAKGDFVTLVRGAKRAVRAVVAKNENGIAGIKILKIYSLALWNQLRAGTEVQVLRGDDTFFNTPASTSTADNQGPRITTEENLFDETTVLEDESLAFEEDGKRILKNDNIVSLSLSLVDAGTEGRSNQPNGSWMYQVEDNIWLEASYGQSLVKGFPASDIDTKITNFVIRAKYAVRAPLDSYALPYIGYQIAGASSPGAGEDETGTRTQDELEQELDDVESLKKNQLIFGATFLKRLVPGWFVRVDLGADLIAGGFSLEF